jgi:hypothetical protein
MAPKRVFLTSPLNAAFTWAKPADWNPGNNKVECVGGGGNGAGNAINPLLLREGEAPSPQGTVDHTCGTGGGGGAYAYRDNCNPTSWPVSCWISGGGSRGPTSSNIGTWFNQTSYLGTGPASVRAETGGNGAGGGGTSGGAAGVQVWPQGNAGGSSGISSLTNSPGRGGGGGGGPHGIGATTSLTQVGTSGDGGNAAAGAVQAAGGVHLCWDATHGICGGAGGANNVAGGVTAGPPANGYGCGSGGMSSLGTNSNNVGRGAQGMIVITWEPLLPGATAMIMA